MARKPKDVTEAEMKVLMVLWEQGPCTIRRITDAIYPRGGVSHYATVQKLLERLAEKKYVRRNRQRNVNVFAAALDKDTLIGQQLRMMAEKLCGGLLTPLLTSLVRVQSLSERERRELKELIDHAAPSEENRRRS